jgi:hypothetical protein
VDDKDKEEDGAIVALLDSACREKLFKFLTNSEVDRNIVYSF